MNHGALQLVIPPLLLYYLVRDVSLLCGPTRFSQSPDGAYRLEELMHKLLPSSLYVSIC